MSSIRSMTKMDFCVTKMDFWVTKMDYRHAAGARNPHVQETQAAALRFFLRTRLPPAGAKKPARAFRGDL